MVKQAGHAQHATHCRCPKVSEPPIHVGRDVLAIVSALLAVVVFATLAIALVLLCIDAAEGGEVAAVAAVDMLTGDEAKLLEITNAERTRHGLPAVTIDAGLQQSARSHAIWMASRQSMTHSGGPFCENIAMGQDSPTEAMYAWMHSPGHRANLLRDSARVVGVAVARTASGTPYWCWQATSGGSGASGGVSGGEKTDANAGTSNAAGANRGIFRRRK